MSQNVEHESQPLFFPSGSPLPLITKLETSEIVLKDILATMHRPVVQMIEERLYHLVNLIAEIPEHHVELISEWNHKVVDLWRQFALFGGNVDEDLDLLMTLLMVSTNGGDNSSDQNGSTTVTASVRSPQSMENESGNNNNNIKINLSATSNQLQQLEILKPVAPIRKRSRTSTICESKDLQASNKPQTVATKRRKSNSVNSKSTAARKFHCKYVNCGKSFGTDRYLKHHEHFHLGIMPFSCGWPGCVTQYRSVAKRTTVEHIRMAHLGLSRRGENKKVVDSQQKNLLDYIVVDTDKLHQRLV